MRSLDLYCKLLEKIDDYQKKLLDDYGKYISCHEGCDECCILESVFAVEAYAIYKSNSKSFVIAPESNMCPFLEEGKCTIYQSRPVICRTHGYPVFVDGRVDFCPKNFIGADSIDSGYILNLKSVNESLATINIIFLKEIDDVFFKSERIALKEILHYIIKKKNQGKENA